MFTFLFLIFLLIFPVFGKDEDGNLPAEELKRKIERLSRQSAQMLTQLALLVSYIFDRINNRILKEFWFTFFKISLCFYKLKKRNKRF